jgi:hypothetical protein
MMSLILETGHFQPVMNFSERHAECLRICAHIATVPTKRSGGISQEGTGIIRVLVVMDGMEFDAKSILPIRTNIEGVSQGDGIKCRKCCREDEKKKQKPARADLTLLPIESIEPMHSQSERQNTEQ